MEFVNKLRMIFGWVICDSTLKISNTLILWCEFDLEHTTFAD